MTPLAVITNRGSTRNLRGDNWVDPMLARETHVMHLQIERADQVEDAVRRCAAAGAQTIAVNGGDGTAGLIFAALLNGKAYPTLPALALLPAGKTNMTTADWSLTGTPEAALAAVLQSRREGTLAQHAVSRPVLALHQSAGAPPLYGAFFGAAEIVDGIRFCRKHIYPLKMPNALSHAAAISVLFWRGLRGASESGALTVEKDGVLLEQGNFFVVAVTALDELLLGLRPAPAIHDGALNYISLRGGPGAIAQAIPAMLRRRVGAGPGRNVRSVNRLTLTFTGAYTLDGELYEAQASQPLILDGNPRLNFIRIPP
ncbi:MAG: hypothetical protein K2P94_02405 [Rhodospirillaceae bacterium]|nr:hypothetical protein [Rhodospirillaceae bacterium]